MAVIFTNLTDGQAVNAATFNAPMILLENAILDLRNGIGYDGGAVMNAVSPLTSLGDLLVHDGSDNIRMPAGIDGQTLFVDSGETAGLRWGDPAVTGSLGTSDELTIASGAITVTQPHHTVDTEGDASSDDLDTINGLTDGEIVFVRAQHTDRTVVVKHGTGNIRLNGGIDFSLDNLEKGVLLIASGSFAIGVGVPVTVGAGSGTVTSVGLSAPAEFVITGSPVTTSGTLAVAWDDVAANRVLAGPTTGADDAPAFRALVADDIPALDAAKITSGAFDAARIPNLDAAKITSGVLGTSQIPSLAASKITSGTFDAARIPNIASSKLTDRLGATLVAAAVLGSPAANIDLTSISGDYSHLQLRVMLRSTLAANTDSLLVRFNGVSAASYWAFGTRIAHSAALTTFENLGATAITFTDFLPAGSTGSNRFAQLVIDIQFYSGTVVHKTMLINGMLTLSNSSGDFRMVNGLGYYADTAAVSRITLLPGSGSFAANSSYALYGIG